MGKQKSKGEFFVELKGADTIENITNGLRLRPGFLEYSEQKEYKGEEVIVYKVNPDFIKDLYRNKVQWTWLKFESFIEVNGTLRRWELFRPDVMKKARVGREAWKKGRKGIKYDKPDH